MYTSSRSSLRAFDLKAINNTNIIKQRHLLSLAKRYCFSALSSPSPNMESHNTFNIAVTGNAPFLHHRVNTSQLIRDALPDTITQDGKKLIRVMKYSRDTLDTFDDVRRVSNEIWGGKRSLFSPKAQQGEDEQHVEIDAILHLGMIGLNWDPNQFRLETVARRDGYTLPGADNKIIDSEHLKSLGLPDTLSTLFNVKAAWEKVQQAHPVSLEP
ncbi:hypothetical protein ONZ43_g4570 [Nemania bipapillata]|uniref:Uncharacterized protein n=1 Tax=Nemania bipapillata TaxID=110536 RepID=A0ACC2IKY2_9PEZI|nr:hypothetical protein ONZ43_g4570 [Nemania bipapillata]